MTPVISFTSTHSGAYVFRPNTSTTFPCGGPVITRKLSSGGTVTPLVEEVYQKFAEWAYQVVRLYRGKPYIEVEWTVGPIPIGDGWGKEVISK